MLLLQFGLLLALLPICSFAPGFYCVRKLPWSPLEKLCASAGLSLILVYLVSWAFFCFGPRGDAGDALATGVLAATSAVCCVLALLARKEIAQLFHCGRARRTIAGYGFLVAFGLAMLAMIRHYSGFGWGEDWLEHFQRTLFVLHRFPPSTPIFNGYQLPARPPMANALAAFFLAQTQERFELFQVVFAFFNLLQFLACCLMLPSLGLSRRSRILPLVFLFAASPAVMENATYTWTKALASFFVLLSLWFYLAAWRKADRGRMVAAFVAVGAGLLVHYLAGVYLLFLALHYLGRVFWTRPRKWQELAAVAAAGVLLLATWFGWSMAAYGANVTFKSNSSVKSAQLYQGSAPVRIALNIVDSIVPIFVRAGAGLKTDEASSLGLFRDNAFAFYQVNVIFSMGLAGGLYVVWLLYGFLQRRPAPREWRFWRVLIPVCVVLGIAVVGERDTFGSAHLTLIPLQALGLSLIAAAFPWKRAAAVAIIAGGVVDFSAGVFLQARMEAIENTPTRNVFTAAVIPSTGKFRPGSKRPEGLSVTAWENWFDKHRYELYRRVLGSLETYHPADAVGQQNAARVRAQVQQDLQQDSVLWLGWWQRHDYTMDFLGDDVAGPDGSGGAIPQALFVLMFVGLTAALIREIAVPRPRLKPVPVRTAARRTR
jgi:hypothetical protein